MRNRHVGLYAAVILAVIVSGCGRAPSTGVGPSIGLEEELPAIPAGLVTKVSADKVRPEPSPAVGVMVDGRWYPKGSAPTVAATPKPDAPQGGKGHLHVSLTLANRMTSFVETIELSVTSKGQSSPAFSHTFKKADLVGSKLSMTATNLMPGDYDLKVVTRTKASVLNTDEGTAKVEADKTTEAKI